MPQITTNAMVVRRVDYRENDRILTLSTCTGRGHATRWVVLAVWAETVPYDAAA